MKTRTIALLATMIWIASGGYMLFLASKWQLDLRVYREAAQLLTHGGDAMKASFTPHRLNFTYSPFALLLFTVLGVGPFGLTETLWWLVNAVALVITIYFLIEADNRSESASRNLAEQRESRYRHMAIAALIGGIAAVGLEPLRSDIDYGQINFLLMLFVVIGITSRRTLLRGSLVGLAAAIKLTPLIYLGGFVRSDRKSLIRGLVVFALLGAMSWVILPKESSEFWLHDLFDASRTGGVASRSNQSWYGLLQRPPFHGSVAAWLVLSTVTVAAGMFVANRAFVSRRFSEAVMALALTELLVSPVSWTHHWSWLVVAPIAIVSLWRRHRIVGWMLIGLLVVATAAPYWWFSPTGTLTDLSCDSLLLAGSAALFVWGCAEVRVWRQSAQVATGRAPADSYG